MGRNVLLEFWTHSSNCKNSLPFLENFQGKIQNIKNGNTGRISSISFTLNKQLFSIVNIYGPNKSYQRESFFQSLADFTNTQNTIIGGDFNMVEELKDRLGGVINKTHLVGSENLKKLIQIQNLHDI